MPGAPPINMMNPVPSLQGLTKDNIGLRQPP
jgi:hypothetical protein